jgi:hypothetical protein
MKELFGRGVLDACLRMAEEYETEGDAGPVTY